VPRHRTSTFPRPRLLNRLHSAIGNGLTLIQAPPGFGKTTLAAEFVRDIDFAVSWVSLDSSCAVPEVFARQLSASLMGDAYRHEPSAASRPGDLKAYLGVALAQSVSSEQPRLLVLDSIDELGRDESTIDLLGWLIEVAPEGFEILLCGRALPPLAGLDQRIASGEVVIVGSAELAFNLAEISLAAERAKSPLAPEAVLATTDGWPVGVMAVLSGTVAASTSGERAQQAAWERYLTTQVWQAIPVELQPVLRRLALSPEIEPAAASALVGAAMWRKTAHWLAEHDFLYESLPGRAIRLNPLLRAFLIEGYANEMPEEFAADNAALIHAAENDGRIADAIEIARARGQQSHLADLIERNSERLILQGSFALLLRALAAIPPRLLEERPLVAAVRARVLSHMDQPHEAYQLANHLLADKSVAGKERTHAMLARMRSMRMLGKTDELVDYMNEVRAVQDCDDATVLGELTYHEAEIALSVSADFPRAQRLLNLAIEQCEAANIQPLGLLATSTLGQLLTMIGDAPAAVTTLTRAAQGWRSIGRSSNLGWVLNNLGMAYLQVGDFESATSVLEEARQEGLQCENQRNVGYATASLADAELALGHWEKARILYEEAIRICAEHAPDETLAALSIAGLSGALLGLGDVQQADFFVKRAVLVSVASSNSYELAICKLQQAAVESASGNHVTAIATASESVSLFEAMETKTTICAAYYRLALCQFRAGKRAESQQSLRALETRLLHPWMVGSLVPLIRENPMFAQWTASRSLAGPAFRELIERTPFGGGDEEAPVPERGGKFPAVVARSLGHVSVSVGGREVTEEAWASARAKELFFLFLANRSGLRKEEAVELLYPELPPEKCNSAFHSNLYRLRKALYADSVVKRDGGYVLNPDGAFTWDVEAFEETVARAEALPSGSPERAAVYQKAMALYQGPFAEEFYSEWAATVRHQLDEHSQQALSVMAGYFAGRKDFEAAAACMERILKANRFNEEAAYRLASFRMEGGQPIAALAFIDDYRHTYEQELGEELPERFGMLRARIAAGAGA
jgi:ATP/maltotriose-dependent transcriptional regulator MalT/DNA-binding SARP family transcriptional activator